MSDLLFEMANPVWCGGIQLNDDLSTESLPPRGHERKVTAVTLYPSLYGRRRFLQTGRANAAILVTKPRPCIMLHDRL